MIIAGMSPTAERANKKLPFRSYYTSEPVLCLSKKILYARVLSLDDFNGVRITSQHGVYLYDTIMQIPKVLKKKAMEEFAQMRQALMRLVIDAYVSERPEAH